MEKEEWKDIKGYEGLYQVSDLGRVKSLKRKVKIYNGTRIVKERILKPCMGTHGYSMVSLSINDKKKTFKVHKLVALAFLNHKPSGHKIVIDHIDSNKNNNSLDNLQLISNRENVVKGKITKSSSSKYIGVSWSKKANKWTAQIKINGGYKYLGYYSNELDACNAYQKALQALQSEEYESKETNIGCTLNIQTCIKGSGCKYPNCNI